MPPTNLTPPHTVLRRAGDWTQLCLRGTIRAMSNFEDLPAIDFRMIAEQGSKMLLSRYSGSQAIAPFSYCISTGLAVADFMKKTGRRSITTLVLGLLLMVAAIPLYQVGLGSTDDRLKASLLSYVVAGGCCTLSGIAVLFLGAIDLRRRTWRVVRERVAQTGSGRRIPVTVEDTATFKKMKSVPEDVGILIVDRQAKVLTIEGVAYRYRIRAEDVTRIAGVRTPNSYAVIISYRIGPTVLSIALFDTRQTAPFRLAFRGSGSAFEREIRRAVLG